MTASDQYTLTLEERLHYQARTVIAAQTDMRFFANSEADLKAVIRGLRQARTPALRLPVRSEISAKAYEADWAMHRLAVRIGIDRRLGSNRGYDTVNPYDDIEAVVRWDRALRGEL